MREYPGKINIANERGSYHGSAVMVIDPAALGRWAEENPGMLVVDMKPMHDGRVLIAYTNAMDPGELEEFQSFQRDWEQFKSEKAAKIAEAEAKGKEAEAAAKAKSEADKKKERDRELELIKRGERCLKHHTHLDKKK